MKEKKFWGLFIDYNTHFWGGLDPLQSYTLLCIAYFVAITDLLKLDGVGHINAHPPPDKLN